MNCQNIFHFKQFSVCQDNVAMKIGTDGVLLGAWTNTGNPNQILDIGTGTGLIALMLAQTFKKAHIDAIDIEPQAFLQAQNNFENSPWSNRLMLHNIALQNFIPNKQYDLIVSNPPFFEENVPAKTLERQTARQNLQLNLMEIFAFASQHTTLEARVNIIFPKIKESKLINIAKQNNFYPQKITYVQGNPQSKIKRILVSFSKNKALAEKNRLIIEEARHQYTKKYIELTKNFYLNM